MKTAEEKARELYPDKEYPDVFGLNMEQLHERSIEHQQILIQRKAFIKGYEYANQQLEVDYQKMFANCSLPNEKQPEQEECEHKWIERCKQGAEYIECLNCKETYVKPDKAFKSTLNQDKLKERLERSNQFLRVFARIRVFDSEATDNLWKCIKLNEEALK